MSGDDWKKKAEESSFVKNIKEMLDGELSLKFTRYLHEITDLEDMNDPKFEKARELCWTLYNDPKSVNRQIGTLMNSIFTHGTESFQLTRNYFNDLLEKDHHYKTPKTISGAAYKVLMAHMFRTGILEELRKASNGKMDSQRIAGVYRLKLPEYRRVLHQIVGQAVCEKQTQALLEWNDSGKIEKEPEPQELSKPSSDALALGLKLKAEADAKRKRDL